MHKCIDVYIYTHVNIYAHTHPSAITKKSHPGAPLFAPQDNIHAHVCIYKYIHTNVCIYIYIYMYIYTYIDTPVSNLNCGDSVHAS